jgi:hypothetical protein
MLHEGGRIWTPKVNEIGRTEVRATKIFIKGIYLAVGSFLISHVLDIACCMDCDWL